MRASGKRTSAHFAEDARPAACCGCGTRSIDITRHWLREHADARETWFICDRCATIGVQWTGGVPRLQTFVPASEAYDAIRQAHVFLTDALEESDLTEDEMHAAAGTFWVRLLCAKQRLEDAYRASRAGETR